MYLAFLKVREFKVVKRKKFTEIGVTNTDCQKPSYNGTILCI
jgi:hypothetical protein